MALTWNDMQRIKSVEAKADQLGFKLADTPYNTSAWVSIGSTSDIYVKPKDDCLPHYSRDTYFFSGTIEAIDHWLQGIEWARKYDETLKLTNSKKRTAKEDAERKKHLMKTIKTGKLVTGKLGGYETIEEDDDDEEFDNSYGYADDGGSGSYA